MFKVKFSCGSNQPERSQTLGPDKGVHTGDGAGVSFTEAGGRVMHVDCRPRADELHFVNAELMTYQGRLASSWRVFPRADLGTTQKYAGNSICGLVDANTYPGPPASLNLSCTRGIIQQVTFASLFGEPKGLCGNLSVNSDCHHPNSSSVVRTLCVGQKSCRIDATQVCNRSVSVQC